MTDSLAATHFVLGCLALTGSTVWQVLWLFAFAVTWVWSLAAVAEKARQVFVPGEA